MINEYLEREIYPPFCPLVFLNFEQVQNIRKLHLTKSRKDKYVGPYCTVRIHDTFEQNSVSTQKLCTLLNTENRRD